MKFEADPDKVRETNRINARRMYAKRTNEILEYQREYYNKNKEKISQRRAALKKKKEGENK